MAELQKVHFRQSKCSYSQSSQVLAIYSWSSEMTQHSSRTTVLHKTQDYMRRHRTNKHSTEPTQVPVCKCAKQHKTVQIDQNCVVKDSNADLYTNVDDVDKVLYVKGCA